MEEEVKTVEEPQEVVVPETTPAEDVVVEKPESVLDKAEITKTLEGMEKKISVFQSKADKAEQDKVNLLKELDEEKRARKALETTIKGLSSDYGDDPAFGETLEKHQTKGKLSAYEAEEETKRKAQQAQIESQRRLAQLKEDISELGVDPMDKRLIDVFNQAKTGLWDQDRLERTMRKEALKIAKGETGKGPSVDNEEMEAVKAELANLKRRLGIEANNTLPVAGSTRGKVTRDEIANYSAKGKTVKQMREDTEKMLDGIY